MSLITQSDLCIKNCGITNAQTLLCQHYDPYLEGILQHRWMHSKNVILKIIWSRL
ncbi:hypothetical protein P692DRAFT_20727146 [Suillus brevipes Sb2]|nr:hypothetical protein P692DRAFT_20727146 [Suillus brevipes Sb2]